MAMTVMTTNDVSITLHCNSIHSDNIPAMHFQKIQTYGSDDDSYDDNDCSFSFVVHNEG